MKLLDKKTTGRPGQAADLHRGHDARHRGAGGHHRQPHLRRDREYKAEFTDATGVVKGDDIRVAGVKVGNVEDVEIVDRTSAMVTFKVDDDHQVTGSTDATDPLPQPRRPALHRADPGRRRPRGCRRGRRSLSTAPPALDLTVLFNGFKPLFEALSPGRRQQAVLRDHPGLPGRGRHPRGPAAPHRVGHHDARQPRPGDRRPHRQPQRGARPHRRPRRAAHRLLVKLRTSSAA